MIENNIQEYIINALNSNNFDENVIEFIKDNKSIVDLNFDSFDNISQMFYVMCFASKHEINLVNLSENEEINCYYNELLEVRKNYEDEFNGKIKILKTDHGILCYRIGNIYYFYNLNPTPCKIILPKTLQNKIVFCIFCNNDKHLKESFILRSHHFDLLQLIEEKVD